MQCLQSTLCLKHCWCQHDKAATFPQNFPHNSCMTALWEEKTAALKGEHVPQPQEAGTLFPCCLCSQNKGFHVLSFMQQSILFGENTPCTALCSEVSSSQRNNKRAFGQECKYLLLCWMQVGMGDITGHGSEKK